MKKETIGLINKMFYFEKAKEEANLSYINELVKKATLEEKELTDQQIKTIEKQKAQIELISRCYNDFKEYAKKNI